MKSASPFLLAIRPAALLNGTGDHSSIVHDEAYCPGVGLVNFAGRGLSNKIATAAT